MTGRLLELEKMSSLWWTSVVVFAAVFAKAKCDSTAFPVIPSHLLECYMDDGIYHRDNRMPSSFEFFLDLLRKLEEGPTSSNMNARELAMALLHYLKLDGIQSMRSSMKFIPSHILPFAPSGPEYFKHRLTLVGLVPRLDRSYMASFNESLTKNQMCNLHFMLSYSIDPYKRKDEKCSPLFDGPTGGRNAEAGSDWHSYQYGGGYGGANGGGYGGNNGGGYGGSYGGNYGGSYGGNYGDSYYDRYRRHIDHRDKVNGVNTGKIHWGKRQTGAGTAGEVLAKDQMDNNNAGPKVLRKRSTEEKGSKKSEVEEIPVEKRKGKAMDEEKDKFTIGDQELLSGGEGHLRTGMQSLVQAATFGKHGGGAYARTYSSDGSSYSDVVSGIPLSDCPVVNGVVTTPYGSLTIGTVIAGIAAGLNPEEIPPTKLSVDPAELESPSDRVNNIWATTLAGTIADTISSSALLEQDNFLILKGGWNESSDPKWYLLANNQFKHMTEVGLRGSLDALLLGLSAKEWSNKFSNLKLSQMLEMYYDNMLGTLGAKNRVQLRPKYIPEERLRKEVYLMSLVLKKQKTNVLTVLNHGHIAREAVAKVIHHIQTIDDTDKSHIGSLLSTAIDNTLNVVAVVDSSWGYENLNRIFTELRYARVINTLGSTLTVLCGKDGRVIASSGNSADFYWQFTKDMLFENCTRGMDFPLIFDTLDTLYRKIFHEEKTSNKINTDGQVTVLFPFDSLLADNADYLTEKSRTFRSNFPDVRLMIAPNGRSEAFLQLVNSPKDLFQLVPYTSDPTLRSVKELAEGLKQSYQRISRPSCGSYFDDDTPGTEISVTRDVSPGKIVYYRLIPQYFYTQKDHAIITIKSKQRTPLTVCHSREMERPAGPTPRGGPAPDYGPGRSPPYSPDFPPEASPYGRQIDPDAPVHCKTITSENYEIDLNNPCEGASSLRECNPLYISLSAPLQENLRASCYVCRLPINVQYEILVKGLTCYNSAAALSVTPFLFALLLLRYLL